ncbi:hypothetical protein F2P58_23265 [Vibrio fortis]|uniref:Uncharacterized protein n=1 Tax=Vibrio fortis TaxID=212667 RepID=A0A5N3QTE5_9VIBR|nr:hypothetical protein [Vibrio fortis]KAB0285438.1 hypothetical protein F2P58_23265 [Vibrio fortis]
METITVEVSPEEVKLHVAQRKREEASKKYAQKKARERQQALAEAGLYGDLDGSRKEAATAVDKAVEGFEAFLKEDHDSRSKVAKYIPVFLLLNASERAVLVSDAVDLMLSAVDNVNLTGIVHRLGDLTEVSVGFMKQRRENAKRTRQLQQLLDQQSSVGGRLKAIKYELKVNTKTWTGWDEEVKVLLGQILFHIVMESTDLFVTETREAAGVSYF